MMESINTDDTIAAISTPLGFGGIGIIRLSGPQSLSIAKKIFKPKNKKAGFIPKKVQLGYLFYEDRDEELDEVYLIYFPAKSSYTYQDVVEINCHGSPVILEEAVRLCLKAGARQASPGEFTLRAYMNGRIDLLQAEAIHNLIEAASVNQAKISFKQMKGGLSSKIKKLRQQIVDILSQIEAAIEFPDEKLGFTSMQIENNITKTINEVKKLVESYDLGKILSEGKTLAIAGFPNTGKSTLFNSLLDDERAIVTPHAGTTRDYLQERVKLDDFIFTLIDTAGITSTTNPIEKEGIKRAKKKIEESDGILFLIDVSQKIDTQDFNLIKKYFSKKILLIFNKIDLPLKADINLIKNIFSKIPIVEISALTKQNINILKKAIVETFVPKRDTDDEIILHLRQKLLLEDIQKYLSESLNLIKKGYPEEYCVEKIKLILPSIGQLSGEIRSEEVIQNIFSQFCIGK